MSRISLVLLFAIPFLLIGCGGNQSTPDTNTSPSPGTEVSPGASPGASPTTSPSP